MAKYTYYAHLMIYAMTQYEFYCMNEKRFQNSSLLAKACID